MYWAWGSDVAPRLERYCATLLVVASAALSQPAPGADAGATAGTRPEEVIVHGRRLVELRDEVRSAEDRFFSIYNSLNSNDDFDIHCEGRAPVGSRIKRRVCEAEFTGELGSMAWAAVIRGSHAVAPAFLTVMRRKERMLAADVRELVLRHPELLQALADVLDARQALEMPGMVVSGAGSAE